MVGTCSIHGTDGKCIKNLIGKHVGKRPLARSSRRWEDNTKSCLNETSCEIVARIYLAENRLL